MASIDEFVYLLAASETPSSARLPKQQVLTIPHLVKVLSASEGSLYDTIDYVISETATYAPFPDARPMLMPIREAFADFVENVAGAWQEAAQLVQQDFEALGTRATPYDPSTLQSRIQNIRDLLPYLDSVLENIKDLLTRDQQNNNDWFFLRLMGLPSAWDKARRDLPHAVSLLHRCCREIIECLVAIEGSALRLQRMFHDWEWVRKYRRMEDLQAEVYRQVELIQTPVAPLRAHVDQLRRHPKLELSKRAHLLVPGYVERLSMSSVSSKGKEKERPKTVLSPSELLKALNSGQTEGL